MAIEEKKPDSKTKTKTKAKAKTKTKAKAKAKAKTKVKKKTSTKTTRKTKKSTKATARRPKALKDAEDKAKSAAETIAPVVNKPVQVDVADVASVSPPKPAEKEREEKKEPVRRARRQRKRKVSTAQPKPAEETREETPEQDDRGKEKAKPAKARAPRERPRELKREDPPRRPARGEEDEGPIDVEMLSNGEEDVSDSAPSARESGEFEMLVNVSDEDEIRIAVLNENRLEELFIERQSTQSLVGNIYKGRIVNVESSIQAVFVDFGLPKNGFLHISDVQPQYFPDRKGAGEDVGRKIPRHSRPPIQECFRRGHEVIVQITKEGVGTKGPTLTTYLSIPGRFLVMMPGMNKLGVSRKIEDDTVRRAMRDQLSTLELPSGMGFIVRTAGQGRPKRDLQRDLNYLLRLWKTVAQRVKKLAAPAGLYRESDLVTRTIRDVYTSSFKRIIVDDEETAQKVKEFLRIAMPRSKSQIELYTDREPLFHRYGIEYEIEKLNMRHVPLLSGGSIVIDTTEAMVTIDVNSGRFRSPDDAEETAFRINVEAAEEIAHQLRLRDLGGLIVCDFIDMRFDRHKRAVERTLRDALKKHKERARILRLSAFGLIEMTRQRRGPSIKRGIYTDCPNCRGGGLVKSPSSVVLDVMRIVQLAAHRQDVRKITITVSTAVAHLILNRKRASLSTIERETEKTVVIRGDNSVSSDDVSFVCEDANGQILKFTTAPGDVVAMPEKRRQDHRRSR